VVLVVVGLGWKFSREVGQQVLPADQAPFSLGPVEYFLVPLLVSALFGQVARLPQPVRRFFVE
jgi:hypothetical protein